MQNILLYAARKSGALLKSYFRKNIVISQKGSPKNLVTEADELSQNIIQETITHYLRTKGIGNDEIGFIGEEHLNTNGRHLFVIDPLDGTNNYASGVEYFAVSIAYFFNEELLSGVIYEPLKDKAYFASRDTGAFIMTEGKKEKSIIKYTPLKKNILITHLTSNAELRKRIFKFADLISAKILATRIYGASVLDLCSLTENHHHIVVYPGDYIWDFAACKLIIEEAGGSLTDWQGKKIKFNFKNSKLRYQIIASHPKNLPEVIKYL